MQSPDQGRPSSCPERCKGQGRSHRGIWCMGLPLSVAQPVQNMCGKGVCDESILVPEHAPLKSLVPMPPFGGSQACFCWVESNAQELGNHVPPWVAARMAFNPMFTAAWLAGDKRADHTPDRITGIAMGLYFHVTLAGAWRAFILSPTAAPRDIAIFKKKVSSG